MYIVQKEIFAFVKETGAKRQTTRGKQAGIRKKGTEGMAYVVIWIMIIAIVIYQQVQKQNRDARQGYRPGGNAGGTAQNYGMQRQQGYRPVGNAGGTAQNYGMQRQQQGYRPVGTGSGGRPQPDTDRGYQASAGQGDSQQELKNRLQQRYGSPSAGNRQRYGQPAGNGQRADRQRGGNPPAGNKQRYGRPGNRTGGAQNAGGQRAQSDILSRAAANVRENETDELELLMNAAGGFAGGPADYGSLTGMTDLRESGELMREVADLMIMGYQVRPVSTRDFVAEGVEMLGKYEGSAGN